MNQDTYGDFLEYQESSGMTFDTTRLHKTWFQEVNFHKNLKILTEMVTVAHMCTRIQNLGWTQLESTLKMIIIGIENASFGYDLTFEIWISESPGLLTGGPSDFQSMSPGGECFAPLDFKKSKFSRFSSVWQNRGGCWIGVVGFTTWGGHNRNRCWN